MSLTVPLNTKVSNASLPYTIQNRLVGRAIVSYVDLNLHKVPNLTNGGHRWFVWSSSTCFMSVLHGRLAVIVPWTIRQLTTQMSARVYHHCDPQSWLSTIIIYILTVTRLQLTQYATYTIYCAQPLHELLIICQLVLQRLLSRSPHSL